MRAGDWTADRGAGLPGGSALEAIGNTPLVALSRMFDDVEGTVLAKLDVLNPTGSSQDRVARQVIEDATAEGRLAPRQSVVELCAGSTSRSFAMACALSRHPFIAVVPNDVRAERLDALRAHGAEVVRVDTVLGESAIVPSSAVLDPLYEAVRCAVVERGAFHPNAFASLSNLRAHQLGTAAEILFQTKGKFDLFCDFSLSGGTLAGCAAAFKEHDPTIRCYLVELAPPGAASVEPGSGSVVWDAPSPNTKFADPRDSTDKSNRARPLLHGAGLDGTVHVTAEEALVDAKRSARLEGLFVGLAAGASLAAARKLLRGPRCGQTLVLNLAEGGVPAHGRGLWKSDGVSAA